METLSELYAEHAELKKALLKEAASLLAGHPVMDDREHKADEKIKAAAKELRDKLPIAFYSNPLKYRDLIESSELYNMLKKAPKGSAHHIHFDCLASSYWFVEFVRQNPDKYRYDEKSMRFHYYKATETKDLLDLSADASKLTKEEFHAKYIGYFVMTLSEINEAKNIWEGFELKILNRLMITQPKFAYVQYTKYAFEEAIEHGLQNIQGRIFLDFIKDDDLKDISLDEQMQIYIDAQKEVQKTHPEFFFSAVVQGLRFWSNEKIKDDLEKSVMLKKKYPELIIGYDVVAEEDKRKLSDIMPTFLECKKSLEKEILHEFHFLLHAGESLDAENDNIYDAVLFGCPRVGHGYNTYRHPVLWNQMKKAKTCIEWNPLSNQILRYVKDLRNHPHYGIYKQGIKFSISSDDPGVFGTDPATWDLVAIVLAYKLSLQDLKSFFLNSVEYSCLEKAQHDSLRNFWFKAWHNYVDSLIN